MAVVEKKELKYEEWICAFEGEYGSLIANTMKIAMEEWSMIMAKDGPTKLPAIIGPVETLVRTIGFPLYQAFTKAKEEKAIQDWRAIAARPNFSPGPNHFDLRPGALSITEAAITGKASKEAHALLAYASQSLAPWPPSGIVPQLIAAEAAELLAYTQSERLHLTGELAQAAGTYVVDLVPLFINHENRRGPFKSRRAPPKFPLQASSILEKEAIIHARLMCAVCPNRNLGPDLVENHSTKRKKT